MVITLGLELGFEEGIVDGTKVKPVAHSRNNDGAHHSSVCKRATLVVLQHIIDINDKLIRVGAVLCVSLSSLLLSGRDIDCLCTL
eukprot:9810915-Ditylum_brightwellii.AAC.1